MVVNAVSSILANKHPNFELVVVDQSKDDETAKALRQFSSDPRFKYLRTATTGKGRALNAGLSETNGTIVAITDDDCTVPTNWLETFALIFAEHPRVAVAFCCVEAAEHDSAAGFVPDYIRSGERMLTTMHEARHVQGLGAGIAIRRNVIEKIGGFDSMLGPGSMFPSCDDRDIAIRALLANYDVYETSKIAVKHFGFRNWEQGRRLARRDFLAIGAAYSKFIKCGRIELIYIPAYEFTKYALWPPIRELLHFRNPRGLVRITAFLRGFVQGLRTPLDKKSKRFLDRD
jgi:glycosyltransferase involved in cell wall biosynthesis